MNSKYKLNNGYTQNKLKFVHASNFYNKKLTLKRDKKLNIKILHNQNKMKKVKITEKIRK